VLSKAIYFVQRDNINDNCFIICIIYLEMNATYLYHNRPSLCKAV